jgi:cytochrome c2
MAYQHFGRRLSIFLAAFAVLSLFAMQTASAAEDEAARQLYAKLCSKCHGLIQEDKLSWRPEYLLVPAVTLPLGPTLTGVYERPAGIIEGYLYSRAMKEMATGWVWDEDALDTWLASTQEFIRGSTMWLKVKEADRKVIIDYLKKYARYRKK